MKLTALLRVSVYLDPSSYEGMLKSGTLVYGSENPIDREDCQVLIHVDGDAAILHRGAIPNEEI
jgi:hypothetical protein